ncbi:DUF4214 domain-containing protein [Candidatus Pacearchaeota archaeon]|nr:DUF4214 domain-containing protein [Candidatus Pacearchaeota archaeon]
MKKRRKFFLFGDLKHVKKKHVFQLLTLVIFILLLYLGIFYVGLKYAGVGVDILFNQLDKTEADLVFKEVLSEPSSKIPSFNILSLIKGFFKYGTEDEFLLMSPPPIIQIPGVQTPLPIDPVVDIGNADFVTHAYLVLLGRDYDVVGFKLHFGQLQSGISTQQQKFNEIIGSPEFINKDSAFKSRDAYVTRVYNNLLLRSPTSSELTNQLTNLKNYDGSGTGRTWYEFYVEVAGSAEFKINNCHTEYYTYERPLNSDAPTLDDLFDGRAYWEPITQSQEIGVNFNPVSTVTKVWDEKLPVFFDDATSKYYAVTRGFLPVDGIYDNGDDLWNLFLFESNDGITFNQVIGSGYETGIFDYDDSMPFLYDAHVSVDNSVCPSRYIMIMECHPASLCASYSTTPEKPETWTKPKLLVESTHFISLPLKSASTGISLIDGNNKYIAWAELDDSTTFQDPANPNDEGDESLITRAMQVNNFDTLLGNVGSVPATTLLNAQKDTHCSFDFNDLLGAGTCRIVNGLPSCGDLWNCNAKGFGDWKKEGNYYYGIEAGGNYYRIARPESVFGGAPVVSGLNFVRSSTPLGLYTTEVPQNQKIFAARDDFFSIGYPTLNNIDGELYLYYSYSKPGYIFGDLNGNFETRSKLVWNDEICDNGIDDDGDTLIDCADVSDCNCGKVEVVGNNLQLNGQRWKGMSIFYYLPAYNDVSDDMVDNWPAIDAAYIAAGYSAAYFIPSYGQGGQLSNLNSLTDTEKNVMWTTYDGIMNAKESLVTAEFDNIRQIGYNHVELRHSFSTNTEKYMPARPGQSPPPDRIALSDISPTQFKKMLKMLAQRGMKATIVLFGCEPMTFMDFDNEADNSAMYLPGCAERLRLGDLLDPEIKDILVAFDISWEQSFFWQPQHAEQLQLADFYYWHINEDGTYNNKDGKQYHEINWDVYRGEYYRYLGREWQKWLIDNYGSVANARVDFGLSGWTDQQLIDSVAIAPYDDITNICDEVNANTRVSAMRRFMDDLVNQKFRYAVEKIKEVDNYHYVTSRLLSDLTPSCAVSFPYDTRSTAKHLDIVESELYSLADYFLDPTTGLSLLGDEQSNIKIAKALVAVGSRYTSANNIKPTYVAEFGLMNRNDEPAPTEQESTNFLKYAYEGAVYADIDSINYWVYSFPQNDPAGRTYSLVEDEVSGPRLRNKQRVQVVSDYESVIKSSASIITNYVTMDLDKYANRAKVLEEAASLIYNALISNPSAVYSVKTTCDGKDSATTQFECVGYNNIRNSGEQCPLKCFNAEISKLEIREGINGQWVEVKDGQILQVDTNNPIYARAKAGNLLEGKWKTPQVKLKAGSIQQSITTDVSYLQDYTFAEFQLSPGLLSSQTIPFKMEIDSNGELIEFGEKIDVVFDVNVLTCADYGGDVCDTAIGEICPGNQLDESNTQYCCDVQCVQPSWTSCSECGTGLFNLCDQIECYSISEGCYYEDGLLNTCTSCSGLSCDGYVGETDCTANRCDLNCEWDGNNCVNNCFGEDIDADGYYISGGECGELDCNDNDASIYPNAPELCDGKDNQCSGNVGYGEVDEGCSCSQFGGDADGDGICQNLDNCPAVPNPSQNDLDNDEIGDLCDTQTCGNNALEIFEECDNGITSGDGCSSGCVIESGWICNDQSPSVCQSLGQCSDCGVFGGFFCSRSDCEGIGACYFIDRFGLNECIDCSTLSCGDYVGETDCIANRCSLSCEWDVGSVSCVEQTGVEICNNLIDDDGDSLIDCADVADCTGNPACVPGDLCQGIDCGQNAQCNSANGNCECTSGFTNCNSDFIDGCEINLQIDENNCGYCGTVCLEAQECNAGVCEDIPQCINNQIRECFTGQSCHGTQTCSNGEWGVCTLGSLSCTPGTNITCAMSFDGESCSTVKGVQTCDDCGAGRFDCTNATAECCPDSTKSCKDSKGCSGVKSCETDATWNACEVEKVCVPDTVKTCQPVFNGIRCDKDIGQITCNKCGQWGACLTSYTSCPETTGGGGGGGGSIPPQGLSCTSDENCEDNEYCDENQACTELICYFGEEIQNHACVGKETFFIDIMNRLDQFNREPLSKRIAIFSFFMLIAVLVASVIVVFLMLRSRLQKSRLQQSVKEMSKAD